MSFAGATGALVLVFAVASVGGRFSMSALLLSGVAVSAFIAAIISAIILFTENLEAQRDMLFWLAGGLDASRWSDVRLSLPFVLFGVAVAVFMARDLNLLMVSDDEARSLGVRVGLTRNSLLLAASLITGTAVAFSGTIAFVGLIVPHALRLVTGADHRVLVPLSALGGGGVHAGRRYPGPDGHFPRRGERGDNHRPSGRSLLPDAAGPEQGAGFDAVNLGISILGAIV